jgi:hypothetical protein
MCSRAERRFTGADLPFIDQHPGDPQSWNLYGYVRNSPLIYVDPDGHVCFGEQPNGEPCPTDPGGVDRDEYSETMKAGVKRLGDALSWSASRRCLEWNSSSDVTPTRSSPYS